MKLRPHIYIIGVALSLLCCPAFINADTNDAFFLNQVILDQKELENLSVEKKIRMHHRLNRSSCYECSEVCRGSIRKAESYRDDLKRYVKRLYRCVEGNDLTNDCYLEFRKVKSTHGDFESAVTKVNKSCD